MCGQVVGGQAAGAGGGGGVIQNQKQEPHTKMWGKMCAMVQLHMCLVYSTHRSYTCMGDSPHEIEYGHRIMNRIPQLRGLVIAGIGC